MKTFKVTIDGFKTKEQALAFLSWYEGGGEQTFYEYLDIVGKDQNNGCNINIHRKGNSGYYYDELKDGYYAEVK